MENIMVNKVILIGNVGSLPELRHTKSGTPVAMVSVATTERWKGSDGQMQESTEWHRVVVWRRLAEISAEYLAPGSKVYFEGKIQTRKWQDQENKDRYTTEIIAREMKMLGGGRSNELADQNLVDSGAPEQGDDVPF